MKKELITKLIEDFNSYSELVALNYAKKKEGKCDESLLQWNRGSLNKIEEYLNTVAEMCGIKLRFECREHEFGFDDWKRTLEYRTVKVDCWVQVAELKD